MKLLFASDSFKGSLTSEQTIELLTKAANEVFDHPECGGVPVADGGEGTTDAVIRATGGKWLEVAVHGPLFEERTAHYGQISDERAILEMAEASGLPMVPEDQRNPLNTTTYGTGEILKDALERGFRDISIAIGGSATNDGGIGCMRALGVKFLDRDGTELEGRGSDLARIARIDVSGLDPRVKESKFTVMCDVSNPLCGPDGATYTFGKQKGGTPEILDQLEAGMINYRDLLKEQFGVDCDQIKGAGAAGGLGAALRVFLNGEMKLGIETVLDLIDFDQRLEGVDLVVTGEGRTDWQSCFGKVMQGVGDRCKAKGIPAIGLSGGLGEGAEQIFEHGIDSLMTTVRGPVALSEAMEKAPEFYYNSAVRMLRLVKVGLTIAGK